jgi:hypothetical protein
MTVLDRETRRIVAVYEAAEAELERRYAEALANTRATAAQARLRELLATVAETKASLDASVREIVPGAVVNAYEAGGMASGERIGTAFSFTQGHVDAVKILAEDTMGDLLRGNARMSSAAKRTIREATRTVVRPSPLVGETQAQATKRLKAELVEKGIAKVVYRNGARVSVGEYARVVASAKLAVARNTAGTAHAISDGVRFFEGSDGTGCGLTTHDDPNSVDGNVFTAEVAMGWPISHPGCVRSWLPRIDVESDEEATHADSVTAPESRADQRAFEAALATEKRAASKARAARSQARARGRSPRVARGA